MRVFVRNVRTARFFKAPGEWTENIEEAHDFERTCNAIESKNWSDEEVVELVFSFGEQKYDLNIVLGPSKYRPLPQPRATASKRNAKKGSRTHTKSRRVGKTC